MTKRLLASCLMTLGSALAFCAAISIPARGTQVTCPGADVTGCREHGKLVRQNGEWISPCGPNALIGGHDMICEDIVRCPAAAGGFGRFLQAVTGKCESKTFDGYHGLDGLTFGILDWTADNLPAVFEVYRKRFPAKFASIFGDLQLQFKGECLDPKWACEKNQAGSLSCEPAFHKAFAESVRDPELQTAQLDFAMHQFLERVAMYQPLGLKTQYGVVALAVVANNLRSTSQCKPENWMQQCKDPRKSEAQVVDCMLDKYVQGACRNSAAASKRRGHVIEEVFKDHKSELYEAPDLAALEKCSNKWGLGSGAHPK